MLVHRFAVQAGAATRVGSWSLWGDGSAPEILSAALSDGSLVMSSDGDAEWVIRHRGGTSRSTLLTSRPQSFDLANGTSGWWLAPNKPAGVHRVVVFEPVAAEESHAP